MKYLELLERFVNDPDYTFDPHDLEIGSKNVTFVCHVECYRNTNGQNLHFGDYKRAAEIAASTLQTIFPEFSIRATEDGNLHISYEPKSSEDYEAIKLWKERKWQTVFS